MKKRAIGRSPNPAKRQNRRVSSTLVIQPTKARDVPDLTTEPQPTVQEKADAVPNTAALVVNLPTFSVLSTTYENVEIDRLDLTEAEILNEESNIIPKEQTLSSINLKNEFSNAKERTMARAILEQEPNISINRLKLLIRKILEHRPVGGKDVCADCCSTKFGAKCIQHRLRCFCGAQFQNRRDYRLHFDSMKVVSTPLPLRRVKIISTLSARPKIISRNFFFCINLKCNGKSTFNIVLPRTFGGIADFRGTTMLYAKHIFYFSCYLFYFFFF